MIDTKSEYLKLLSECDVDEGLVEWLVNNGFFESPATTKFHHSYDGGLCKHSLEVANLMVKLNDWLKFNLNREELLRVGLLHDISKALCYEKSAVNKKIYSPDGNKFDELGNFYWQSQLEYRFKDDAEQLGNYGFTSYLIASKYVSFTGQEVGALSNYVYVVNPNNCVNTMRLMENNQLLTLLHVADTLSSYGGINDLSL